MSPRPHGPHLEHTGRGTPAALPRERAAGGGTAHTRRPSQQRQAIPPGDGPPPPPRHAAPTGHAGQGDSVGPPQPRARAQSTWVVDPNSPPSGRAVRGGGAPDIRRPSQQWKAHLPGTPLRPAPTACGWRTPTACREGRQPGEGQRPTPDAPHNGGRPPPPGTCLNRPRGARPPQGMQAEGTVPGPHTRTPAPTGRVDDGNRQPAQRVGSQARGSAWPQTPLTTVEGTTPRGHPSAYPTASDAGPQERTLWSWCWVPAACPRGWAAGGGTAPDTRCPSQQWQANPPGDSRRPAPQYAAPAGHAGRGNSAGPPHPHTRANSTWVTHPDSPPGEQGATGRGGAPDLRRPTQRR